MRNRQSCQTEQRRYRWKCLDCEEDDLRCFLSSLLQSASAMRRFASLIRKNSNDTQQQAPPRSMSPADLDDARFIPTPYATHSRRATVAAMPVDPLVELERELAATSIRRSASHSQAVPPAPPSSTTAVRDAGSSTDAAPRRASSSRSTARAPLPSLPPQAIAEDPATECADLSL